MTAPQESRMTTLQEAPPEYCYSTDEEFFNSDGIGDVIDELRCELDERAYEAIGEIYGNCFTDVGDDAKNELGDLILAWAKKHVNIRYWKVGKVQECKITTEDLE